MYKLFVSHSTKDSDLARLIKAEVEGTGRAHVYLAEDDVQLGIPIELKVRRNLRSADAVLVLVTRNGLDSQWVQQEVGAAVADKLVIPMVERGADTDRLGMISSRERLYFGPDNAADAITALAKYIASKAGEKNAKELAFLLLIAAGLFLAFVSDRG
jgi:TIR domain